MRFSTAQCCISPLQPVCPAGFLQQTSALCEVKDPLYAHILAFDTEDCITFLIFLDSLGVPSSLQMHLQQWASELAGKDAAVIVSCTHTHFAPDAKDVQYMDQLYVQLTAAMQKMTFNTYDSLSWSFAQEPFDKVGTSRISHHHADVRLSLFSIYDADTRLATVIIYNCHPTILRFDTPYFSSEYPGVLISLLKTQYPSEFFAFAQGAAGDISTRFTRKAQDHEAMEEMASLLNAEISRLMDAPADKHPLSFIHAAEESLSLKHVFAPIDLSDIPDDLSPREITEIYTGEIMRQKLEEQKETMPNAILLAGADIGGMKFVFCPCELFSWYQSCLKDNEAVLVCYSCGYAPYVTEPGFSAITYELFTDTFSKDTKQRLIDMLANLSSRKEML